MNMSEFLTMKPVSREDLIKKGYSINDEQEPQKLTKGDYTVNCFIDSEALYSIFNTDIKDTFAIIKQLAEDFDMKFIHEDGSYVIELLNTPDEPDKLAEVDNKYASECQEILNKKYEEYGL